jgi:hypothetical protein
VVPAYTDLSKWETQVADQYATTTKPISLTGTPVQVGHSYSAVLVQEYTRPTYGQGVLGFSSAVKWNAAGSGFSQGYFSYAGTSPLTSSFSANQGAFGLYLDGSHGSSFNVVLNLADGEHITKSVTATGSAQYFGWVAPFTAGGTDYVKSFSIADAGNAFKFGDFYAGAVGSVPEPGTWAMMIAGLALVGFELRRRGRLGVLRA